MEKELSIFPSLQQKKDTLYFLVNEYFVKSKLSKLEVISNSKDEELSILMDELYKITTFIDITKELIKEKLIQRDSQSQFSSTLNKSVINSKRKYKPLLSQPESRMRLSSLKKPNSTKPFLNYTQKQPFKRDLLNKHSSNQLTNHKIDKNNKDKTKVTNFTMKKRPKQLNDINIDEINDNNLNRYHFNSGHSSSHRNTFKFEPKKKTLLKVIQSVEINNKKEHVIKIKMNQSNNSQKTLQKNHPNISENIFTNKNYFNILENIFLFLPNSNDFMNLTKNTRKIFLLSKIKEVEDKIINLTKNNENNLDKIGTTQKDTKNEIDKILETELLKHKEVKLKDFLQKIE